VDTTLASTSEHTTDLAIAGASSRKHRGGGREKRSTKSIAQTIADICKFITDSCIQVRKTFFNTESELAMEEKYEKLRDWRTMGLTDYKLPDIFD